MVRKLQLAIILIILFVSQSVFGLGLGYDRGGGGFIRDDPNTSYEYFLKLNYPDANSVSVSKGVATIDSDIGGGWTYTDPNKVCVTDTTDIVGIGTAAPGAKLDIHPHAAGIIGLNIDAYTGYTANFLRARDPNDNNLVTVDKDGDIATTATVSANGAVLTGDTNTFDITSGTGSLNVAAGKTVDIDMDLTVDGTGTTITGADQANTITLNESLTIGGGFNFTLTAEDTAGIITLDEQTLEVEGQGDNTQLTKLVNANDAAATLTIEGTSATVNQDTTSDGSPSFAKVTTPEIEYSGDITVDASDSNTSHFKVSNSGAGNAQIDLNGSQISSDALSDVASIGMLDEDETVSGAWAFQYQNTTTKTDDYTVLTSDLGSILIMNASTAKAFTLPSVGAANDGAIAAFLRQGAGKLSIDAADTDIIDDSGAGDTIYNDMGAGPPYAYLELRYIHAITTWVKKTATLTWVTTD